MGTDQTFHFISGLPRAGSTLLSAILRQNPRFHAGASSPVAALCMAIVNQVSVRSEWSSQVSHDQRQRLIHGIFQSFYADLIGHDVIFDTNRIWSARLPLLLDLFPSAKVIACVRNVAWIMDSIERIYRSNPYENSRLFQDEGERGTVYARVQALAQNTRLVGMAWTALREAVYGEHADSLLLVEYESLTRDPKRTMARIYEFIGEPYYPHDFDRLEFDTPDYDATLGLSGMHRVRPKVSYVARRTILPPDIFEKFSKWSFWEGASSRNTSSGGARQSHSKDLLGPDADAANLEPQACDSLRKSSTGAALSE
jgi:sulfotransferase